LKEADLDQIGEFKKNLDREIKSACTFGLMVAAFVIYSRLSDDLFLDFRSWAHPSWKEHLQKSGQKSGFHCVACEEEGCTSN
jgi:hypothetical protein